MATQTLTAATSGIATVVANVTGINAPQATPAENTSEYPMAMVYPIDGQGEPMSAGWDIALINFAIDLLTPRRDIATDLPILVSLLDGTIEACISEVVVNGFFGGTISTFSNWSLSLQQNYPYAGVDMIGYRIILEGVKLIGERS